jgi:hypothetical protein
MKLSKTLAGCIDVWTDCWEYSDNTVTLVEAVCQNTELPNICWKPAPYLGKDTKRQSDYLNLTAIHKKHRHPITTKLFEDFHMVLTDATAEYMLRYGIREDCFNNSSYQLLRYQEGGEYPNHYDGPTITGRHISAILYINDNYEGGELIFPLHNIWIKPKAGMLVMFPSAWAYQHQAKPVTKGTKYAIVTWLHDRENVNESPG